METTEQFWWRTRARGESAETSTCTPGVRGREHPFGLSREERTKKSVRRCETSSSTDIFGRKLEGRRVREGSRSRGRQEGSSSTCTPASTCRSSKEEHEGVQRRVHRRKESGNREEHRSEEEKRRQVAQMKDGEDEKDKRMVREKELEEEKKEEEEEAMMAQAHSLLLTMDSMLSLEGNSLQHSIQLLESPIPAAPAVSQKASSDDISGTKRSTIDPLVSKRPEKILNKKIKKKDVKKR